MKKIPILIDILLISFMSQLVKLSKNRWSQHILNIDSSCTLRIKEESEFLDGTYDILLFELFLYVFQVRESWNQFGNIFFQVSFGQIAIAVCIVQTDMNSSLEQIIFAHDRVEEWLHINSAILISIKF